MTPRPIASFNHIHAVCWLDLGATDTDHRDVNVVEWTSCDLEIIRK